MRPTWRNRVTLGKTLASADRTLSMRLTVVGLSLPYPHPLPDIEPEASNTSMASSVQGARRSSSTRSAWAAHATITATGASQMDRGNETMSCVPEGLAIGAH